MLQKLFIILILNFILFVSAIAQVYPVSVTTQLTPPYSVTLADYAAPGCEQLKVIIVQRDLTQAPYRMYLKMEIALNGQVIMRTVRGYMPFPLTLEPGLPTVISGSDLYPFLDPKNIDFVGYSRETYLRTKSLPEGAYVITFTAYDYARPEVALSAGGSMYCYLSKSDPPLLNLPANNTGVTALPSQYIIFQWLPRTTSSPNSAFTTKYKFELFEIRLDGRSPSEIVQSSRPIYTAETDQSSLAYTIANPPLETGLRYAWRVRAFDTEGRDYIRNNGYSEVFNFVYGVADATALPGNAVENFMAEAISARKGKLSWDASAEFDSYKVYYRLQGNDNKWYEEETVRNFFDLAGLSPGKIYECRVQGKKNKVWGGFSVTDTLKTTAAAVVVCGNPYQSANIANREPLQELRRLQEIDAGGFMVTVIEATGGNGNFSGKGFVQVPLFANKKIRCDFENISVNTDYQLLQGDIKLITDKPDGTDNALWDVDAEFEGGKNNGTVKDGTDGVSVTLPDVVIPGPEAILLDTASREILVVTTAGDTIRADVSQQLGENAKTITVKDEEGNLYSVDTQTGKATSIGKAPAEGAAGQVLQASALNADKGLVYFEPASGKTKYAMDKRNKDYSISKLFTDEYKTLSVPNGTPYDVPFKLIPVGETDVVLARAEMKDKTLNPDSIVFQSSTGTRYAAQASGKKGEYLLTLPSGKDNDGIDVYAVYPNKHGQPFVLGKLSVISYSTKRPKVVLVPVNGNTLDAAKVKEELDKVYLPVAVDWQVSLDEDFSTTVDSLNIMGSGLFSQYTDGMKELNNKFIDHKKDKFDPSALYLFVLQHSGDANATGDMPRSKQFGYLFTQTARKGGEAAIYRTIAHEVSHGIFRLKHTFDSQYDIAQASTQNLMDYTGGMDLVKHQWDAIHAPGLVIGMFEGDEDGMHLPPPNKIEFRRLINRIRCAYYKKQSLDISCKSLCYFSSGEFTIPGTKRTYSNIFVNITGNGKANLDGKSLVIKGTNCQIWFSTSTLHKEDLTDFKNYLYPANLNPVSEANAIVNIANSTSNDKCLNICSSLSECVLDNLTPNGRTVVLKALISCTQFKKYSFEAIIKLFSSVKLSDQSAFYQELKKDPELIRLLLEETDDETRGKIVESLTKLATDCWTSEDLNVKKQAYYFDFATRTPDLSGSFNGNDIQISCTYSITQNELTDSEKKVFIPTTGIKFYPFAPVLLCYYNKAENKWDVYKMPALYLYDLAINYNKSKASQERSGNLQKWTLPLSVPGIFAKTVLIRFVTWAGLLGMTTDKIIEFEPIKTQLLGTEAGKNFLDLWPTIYNTVIVADIATNVLSGFVESSGKVKSLFKKLSQEDAQTIEGKIQEAAEELAKRKSVNTAGKTGLLTKLIAHTNLSSWVSKLDDVADAALISRIDNLTTTNPSKLAQLDDFYRTMKAPAGKKGMIDFDVLIDGKNLHYDKTGMPDFVPHTPTVNGSKIKYQSQTLSGSSIDMTAANNWAVGEFGVGNVRKIPGKTTRIEIKIGDDWIEHTWHHHQDGRTMFPVPSSLHSVAPHSGGASIIEKGLQDFFLLPNF